MILSEVSQQCNQWLLLEISGQLYMNMLWEQNENDIIAINITIEITFSAQLALFCTSSKPSQIVYITK